MKDESGRMKPTIRNQKSETIIAGFGGQGVLFAGGLLGRAGIQAGLTAAESSSYGAESRGSACFVGVVLSDEPIPYPKVRRPDLLIALSQGGYDKFTALIKPGGRIFYDCDMIQPKSLEGVDQAGIHATTIAAQMGSKAVANVVMLAAAVITTGIVPMKALREAVKEQSPAAYLAVNLKAVEEGWRVSKVYPTTS